MEINYAIFIFAFVLKGSSPKELLAVPRPSSGWFVMFKRVCQCKGAIDIVHSTPTDSPLFSAEIAISISSRSLA